MAFVKLNLTGAFLLSIKDYRNTADHIPQLASRWWLIDKGRLSVHVATVDKTGRIEFDGTPIYNEAAVRPALQISNLPEAGLKPGDKMKISGRAFTVISRSYAISDTEIAVSIFGNKSESYKDSEIKQLLETWFKELRTEYNAEAEKIIREEKLSGTKEGVIYKKDCCKRIVANRLRDLMEIQDTTPAAFAEANHVNVYTVYKWMEKASLPSYEMLTRIAENSGMELADIVPEEYQQYLSHEKTAGKRACPSKTAEVRSVTVETEPEKDNAVENRSENNMQANAIFSPKCSVICRNMNSVIGVIPFADEEVAKTWIKDKIVHEMASGDMMRTSITPSERFNGTIIRSGSKYLELYIANTIS